MPILKRPYCRCFSISITGAGMGYKVKLSIFEGPFDLLVYLIENAQMNIYDIKISEITRQYLGYIDIMREKDVAVAIEFMVLAAQLIEIKSKMLLPGKIADGDGVVDEDPREGLVARILEYKKFKILSAMLAEREEAGFDIWEKPQEDLSEYTDEPDEYLSLELSKFVSAFEDFLLRKQRMEDMEKRYARIERQRETTEIKIDQIKNKLMENEREFIYFRELLNPGTDRYDIALTFVSMLEMIRQRRVVADQKQTFGDIRVISTDKLDEAMALQIED